MVVRSTPASSSRRDSWRPRSGRKLKKTAASLPGRSRGPARDHDRFDELVGDTALVARADGVDGDRGLHARSVEDRADGRSRAVPALVAVHRVVAAADGRDAVGGELGEVGRRRSSGETSRPSVNAWIQVRSAIPSRRRQLEQRQEVLEVAVHATAGDEPEQVDVAVALAGARERADERLVLEEGAVRDRRVHAHQVLEEDPPRADRQVAHLGVPHLTRWEPDGLGRRLELSVREALREPVEHGRRGKVDGIARPGRRDPPAVEDHQRDERDGQGDAARQIAANDSGSSEAPPTSAPSTSGWASSSAAFSGLTEPP